MAGATGLETDTQGKQGEQRGRIVGFLRCRLPSVPPKAPELVPELVPTRKRSAGLALCLAGPRSGY